MTERLGKIFIFGIFSGYLGIYLGLLATGSSLNFGEAVSFEGLLRLLNGLPFATLPFTPPVSLTPYTPLFLLPHWILGQLFSLNRFQEVIWLSRILQGGLLLGLFVSLNKVRRVFFKDDSTLTSFLWACLLVFFYSPSMELALRPDTFSFLCEVWGVFWVLNYLQQSRRRFLLFSGGFFGLSLAFKLNTLGGVSGALLFLLLSKDFKAFLWLSLSFAFSALIFLGGQWMFLGSSFSENILLSIQSRILSFSEAIEVYKKVFDLFLLPLGFYFFLVFWGLSALKNRKQARFFVCILSTSFVLAFLGQLKWGAFHNYFLGFLYLGILPVSLALHEFSKKHRRVLSLFLVGILAIFAVRGLSVPWKIWQEKRFFHELNRLQELVAEKAPNKLLYINAETVALGFVGKSVMGILSEELFFTTPKLGPSYLKAKEAVFNQGGIGAFITPCAYYPPSEWGFSEPEAWTRIQTGRFCLFFKS